MKFLMEPSVEVIAESRFIGHSKYQIPDDGDDATKIGAFAAKGCYDSYSPTGRSNVENQRAIMEHRHGSVMEHATVSLFIEGITRGLTLELNRHRSFAISQRSTRYTKEEDSYMVMDPHYEALVKSVAESHPDSFSSIRQRPDDVMFSWSDMDLYWDSEAIFDSDCETVALYVDSCANGLREYSTTVSLLEESNPSNLSGFDLRKWARGKARNLLPHALETRGTWTNNHRGWRWVIESRSDIHAEPEIRRLVYHIYQELNKRYPVYYDDFKFTRMYDGVPCLVPTYSKV